MEDTLAGFLLNNLRFCSSLGKQDFDYSLCPVNCGIRNVTFWYAASADFARKASGYINIVLNGTRTNGAVSNTSTFFLYELPNLNSTKVKSLKVLLLHAPDQVKYETCKNPKTLVDLQKALTDKNILYQCEDNPKSIQAFMCFQDSTTKECQSVNYALNIGLKYVPESIKIYLNFIVLFLTINKLI